MAPKKCKTNRRKKVKKTWRANMKKASENPSLKDSFRDTSLTGNPLDLADEHILTDLEENLQLSDSEYEDIESEFTLDDDEDTTSTEMYEEFMRKLSLYDSDEWDTDDYMLLSDEYTTDSDNLSDTINLVIRSVPLKFSEKTIMKELQSIGYNPVAVHRMISQATWIAMPLVLVQVPYCEKERLMREVYLFKNRISVELQGRGYKISQCSRCKQFGHTSRNCELLGLLNTLFEKKSPDLRRDKRTVSNDSGNTGSGSTTEELTQPILDNTIIIDQVLANPTPSKMLTWSITGLPSKIHTLYVLEDLKSKRFSVKNIFRIHDSKKVVIELPESESHIWYMSCLMGFAVKVEKCCDKLAASAVKDRDERVSKGEPKSYVIRGVPVGVADEVVFEDLVRKRFNPVSIQRMVKPYKKPYLYVPMHIVQVPKNETYIIDLTCILGFEVKVEPFVKHLYLEVYCTACSKYGHTDSTCSGVEKKKVADKVEVKKACTKTYNYIIKGVPLEFENDHTILESLRLNNYHPIAVHRMQKNGLILPMYLVQLPRIEKNILKLSCLLGFNVVVETFDPAQYPIDQCTKCNNFGHLSSNCKRDTEELTKSKSAEHQTDLTSCEKCSNQSNCKDTEELTKSKSVEQQTDPTSCDKCLNQSPLWSDRVKITPNKKSDVDRDVRGHFKATNQCLEIIRGLNEDFEHCSMDLNMQSVLKSALCVQPVSSSVGDFMDASILMLKSLVSCLTQISDLPGVTSHMINEQIHLLEEMEEIRRSSVEKITENFDIDFPLLK